jgi:dynein heavy chain
MGMTYWTNKTEKAIDKGLKGVVEHLEDLKSQIDEIVNLVRTEITKLDRCTLEALVVLDVHNKDVVTDLINKKIDKVSDFTWQS